VIVGSPIEIEFAVNEIEKFVRLNGWIVLISSPNVFFEGLVKIIYYPETYAPESPGLRNTKD
jgi:hypothetical protein